MASFSDEQIESTLQDCLFYKLPFPSFSDEQIERMLQAVRGLPAGSPELAAALDAIEKNDRWAPAFMLEDVTVYAKKLTKRTRLRDEMRQAVRKAKLKEYLAKHPIRDFDLNDEGAVNNLVQLLYEPEYFDRFNHKAEPETPELRRVTADKPPLSPEEEQHEMINLFRQLAGDPKDWLTDAEIQQLLAEIDERDRKADLNTGRER